jgi:hypothetical protein
VTRVLPSLLLTDGSHAFSLCQNGEHRSKRSEIVGFNSNFAIALRCDTVYLTSARPRDAGSWRIGSFVLDSPHMVLIGKLPLPKWLPSCPEDVRLTIAWDLDHWYVRGHIPWPSLTSLCRLTVFSWSVLNACRHACDAMPLVQTEQLPR